MSSPIGTKVIAAVFQRIEDDGQRFRRMQAVVVAQNDAPALHAVDDAHRDVRRRKGPSNRGCPRPIVWYTYPIFLPPFRIKKIVVVPVRRAEQFHLFARNRFDRLARRCGSSFPISCSARVSTCTNASRCACRSRAPPRRSFLTYSGILFRPELHHERKLRARPSALADLQKSRRCVPSPRRNRTKWRSFLSSRLHAVNGQLAHRSARIDGVRSGKMQRSSESASTSAAIRCGKNAPLFPGRIRVYHSFFLPIIPLRRAVKKFVLFLPKKR